ncbi:Cysteine-rich secretory protein family protein [Rubripirellula obstinata]|uniref:Cysteine-rich secretory protein family protein n=1 Tax=Rubripirellula obstinata TaxID=406547 RepID=A0A5B1CN07_9BACT|nr:CAP domain-containing protein [Rubripirellula obstinata]KAA1261169.1 Cysteine-rich secretory protein family protein [Rubripirellula obstinata]
MLRIHITLFFVLCFASGRSIGNEPVDDKEMIRNVESAIAEQTNAFRAQNGLEPVSIDEDLNQAAAKFARFMAETGKYGHRADGRTPAARAKAAGYRYCVVRENIAYRTNTGEVSSDGLIETFVQGWIDSPPHRENMLADYVLDTGVAVATTDGVTYYAVQLFGRPKSAAIELEVTNRSSEAKTLEILANDSEDTVELPPRGVIRMKRCFPTTLQMQESETEFSITESTRLVITDDGLQKISQQAP